VSPDSGSATVERHYATTDGNMCVTCSKDWPCPPAEQALRERYLPPLQPEPPQQGIRVWLVAAGRTVYRAELPLPLQRPPSIILYEGVTWRHCLVVPDADSEPVVLYEPVPDAYSLQDDAPSG